MNSIFFAFQLGFVILIVFWAMRNDQAGDGDVQQGLLAMRPSLPAQSRNKERATDRRGSYRRSATMITKGRKRK